MTMTNSRLLIELNQTIKNLNRELINPEIEELKMADLEPVIKLVARSRAAYLAEIFKLAKSAEDKCPTTEQLKRLQHMRVSFEELSKASQALEAAIERGYLDVVGHTTSVDE